MDPEVRYLTVAEIAARVRVVPETVLRWIRDGRLSAVRPGGSTKIGYRIDERDLVAFLDRYRT